MSARFRDSQREGLNGRARLPLDKPRHPNVPTESYENATLATLGKSWQSGTDQDRDGEATWTNHAQAENCHRKRGALFLLLTVTPLAHVGVPGERLFALGLGILRRCRKRDVASKVSFQMLCATRQMRQRRMMMQGEHSSKMTNEHTNVSVARKSCLQSKLKKNDDAENDGRICGMLHTPRQD